MSFSKSCKSGKTIQNVKSLEKQNFYERNPFLQPCPCGCGKSIIKRTQEGRALFMKLEQYNFEREHLTDEFVPPIRCPFGMKKAKFLDHEAQYFKNLERRKRYNDPQEFILKDEFEYLKRTQMSQKQIDEKMKISQEVFSQLKKRGFSFKHFWSMLKLWERNPMEKQPEEFTEDDSKTFWFKSCETFEHNGETFFKPKFMRSDLDPMRYPKLPLYDEFNFARLEKHGDQMKYFVATFAPFFRRNSLTNNSDDEFMAGHAPEGELNELFWAWAPAMRLQTRTHPRPDETQGRLVWNYENLRGFGCKKLRNGKWVFDHNSETEAYEGDLKYGKDLLKKKMESCPTGEVEEEVSEILEEHQETEEEDSSILNETTEALEEASKVIEDLPSDLVCSETSDSSKETVSRNEEKKRKRRRHKRKEVPAILEPDLQVEEFPSGFSSTFVSEDTRSLEQFVQETVKEKYLEKEQLAELVDPLEDVQSGDLSSTHVQEYYVGEEEEEWKLEEVEEFAVEEAKATEKIEEDNLRGNGAGVRHNVDTKDSRQTIVRGLHEFKPVVRGILAKFRCSFCSASFDEEASFLAHTMIHEKEVDLKMEDLGINQMWEEAKGRKNSPFAKWDFEVIQTPFGCSVFHFFQVTQLGPFQSPSSFAMLKEETVYSFCRSHKGKRFYERMNEWYYVPLSVLKVIFPGKERKEKSGIAQENCMYLCRTFHQSCSWHEGLLSEELVVQRCVLRDLLGYHLKRATFWTSLAFWVNKSEFQVSPFVDRFVFQRSKPVGSWKQLQGEERKPKETFCICGKKVKGEEVDQHYEECDLEPDLDEVESLSDIFQTCELCGEQKDQDHDCLPKKGLFAEVKDKFVEYFQQQLQTLLEGALSLYDWSAKFVSRYSRMLINIVSATLNIVFFPKSALLNVAIILNELRSEVSERVQTKVETFGDALKHVINRVLPKDRPQMQSQTTREEDDLVANETFLKTFWEIVKSFFPMTNVDAGLLKARQMRIEASIKSLASIRKVHEFLLAWIQHIWFLIQVYVFGADKKELEEAYGLISSQEIIEWAKKVDQFELDILENGRYESKANSMVYSKQVQKEYVQLREEGLKFEKVLLKINQEKVRAVLSLIQPRLKKLSEWMNAIKGSLTQIPNPTPPFVIYLHGEPNSGKTLCVDSMMKILISCKYPGEPEYDSQYDRFQRSRTTAYFDGYVGQKVYVMDDVFQLKSQEIMESELADLLDLSTFSRTHLNTAQLETKASLYFTSDFIVLTSNVSPSKEVIQDHVQESEALFRRIDACVEVVRTGQPDPSVAFDPSIMKFYPKVWNHQTKQFVPVQGPKRMMDWEQFMHWLVVKMAQRERRDQKLLHQENCSPQLTEQLKQVYQTTIEQPPARTIVMQSEKGVCEVCSMVLNEQMGEDLALLDHLLNETREGVDPISKAMHLALSRRISQKQLRPCEERLSVEDVASLRWAQSRGILELEGSPWSLPVLFVSRRAELIRRYVREAIDRSERTGLLAVMKKPVKWVADQYLNLRRSVCGTSYTVRRSVLTASQSMKEAADEIQTTLKTVKKYLWISMTTCLVVGVLKAVFDWFKRKTKISSEMFGGSSSMRTNARTKKIVRAEENKERPNCWYGENCVKEDCVYAHPEHFGGSSSARTNARLKKKMIRSEAIEDRVEQVEKLLKAEYPFESSRDYNASILMQQLRQNVAVVKNLETTSRVRGFFLRETILLVPSHILAGSKDWKEVRLKVVTSTLQDFQFRVRDLPHFVDQENDVMLVQLPISQSLSMRPDIVGKFLKKKDIEEGQNIMDGYLITPEVSPQTNVVSEMIHKRFSNLQFLDKPLEYGDDEVTYVLRKAISYDCDTLQGDCGSLVIRFDSAFPRKIVGFHVAGEAGRGFAAILTQEQIQRAIEQLPKPEIQYEKVVDDEFYPALEDQDVYFDCEGIPMEFVGVLPRQCTPSQPTRSSIHPSPIFEKLTPIRTKPSALKREGKASPFAYGLKRLQHPQIVFPQKNVDAAVSSMIALYSTWTFRAHLYGQNGLLTKEEMVDGIEAHPWIRPMNMQTSPGYPYQLLGGKNLFLHGGPHEAMFWETVERRERAAERGEQYPAMFVDTLKDERLKIAKVEEKRSRIFVNCPMDVNILFRKYFLKFLCFLMDNHVQGEVSVGLNVHDQEWEVLFKRMKATGGHWLAGDYTAWDKRMPLQVAMTLLNLVETFYKRFPDYEQKHALVRKVLIYQSFAGHHIIPETGLVYKVHQAMPSGIPLTATYNSLLNCCLFRVVYSLLAAEQGMTPSSSMNSFTHNVSFVAYGDDHIARVSNLVFPWFNMKTIQQKMAEYGIGYTAPDKSDLMPIEIQEDELVYLKRRFKKDSGRIDAPLALEDVLEILNWVRATKESEKVEAFQSAVRSVYIELTHHDKETFDFWFKKILQVCFEARIQVDITTYEEALQKRLQLKEDSSWVEF